jgi:hypothetical protein
MPKGEINIGGDEESHFYILLIALKGESTAEKKTRGSKFETSCIKYAVCPGPLLTTAR